MKNVNVFNYVKFGRYPQTAQATEQTIQWKILAIEENNMLVISRYGLESMDIYDKDKFNWKNSKIRQWLNNEFYNKAFNEEEKRFIRYSSIFSTVYKKFWIFDKKEELKSDDYIFLLSNEEAEKYFANDDDRRCKPTEYAKKEMSSLWVDASGYGYWWLRSSEYIFDFIYRVYRVHPKGDFKNFYFFDLGRCLVRPALWINLEAFKSCGFKLNLPEKINLKPFNNVNADDYIKFGSYPQTANGEVKPIEWEVLAIEDNKKLVISKYGLDAMRFDLSSNNWKKSEICKWLNKDFYNKAFSETEKKCINPFDGDNVFLLSIEEAEKYFANEQLRICEATDYAVKNGADICIEANYHSDYSCFWWLRSSEPMIVNFVYHIAADGNHSTFGVDNDEFVVRPALWINI